MDMCYGKLNQGEVQGVWRNSVSKWVAREEGLTEVCGTTRMLRVRPFPSSRKSQSMGERCKQPEAYEVAWQRHGHQVEAVGPGRNMMTPEVTNCVWKDRSTGL